MHKLIGQKRLSKLHEYIESLDVEGVRAMTNIMKDNVDVNLLVEMKYNGCIITKSCLDIFYNAFEKNSGHVYYKQSLFEIFKILHNNGMEWENSRLSLYGTNVPAPGGEITAVLLDKNHIDFFMRILPLSKDMNAIWRRDVRSVSDARRKVLELKLCSYIDGSSGRYISLLTPEIRRTLIWMYVTRKKMLLFSMVEQYDVYGNVIGLMKLLNYGKINYGIGHVDVYRSSFEMIIKWDQPDHPFGNNDEIFIQSEQIYTTLCLLISSGYDAKELDKVILLKDSLVKFLMTPNNRWLLRRERPLYNRLPIPLEARLQTWNDGLGGIFTRQQASILLRS